jgi:hypothetical protein
VANSLPPAPPLSSPQPVGSTRTGRGSVLQRLRWQRRPISNWRQSLFTFTSSALLHAVLLFVCSLILFQREDHEEIWTELLRTPDAEPVDDLVLHDQPLLLQPAAINSAAQPTMVPIEADVASELMIDVDDQPLAVARIEEKSSQTSEVPPGERTSGRSGSAKARLLADGGGSAESEAAVAAGLRWIVAHQYPDGSWSFDHASCPNCNGACSSPGQFSGSKSGATGMALLALLGAGHTHRQGEYRQAVQRGLDALIAMGRTVPQGIDLTTQSGHAAFYAHGLATLALCEALAMTNDDTLRPTAEGAVRFIIASQDRSGGGWRYEPSQTGDTSVVGWQVMALKSAESAKIRVAGTLFQRVSRFLSSVQADAGAQYRYMRNGGVSPSMTAVGLLCRMYLGWNQEHQPLQRGVAFLDRTGPLLDNMYYNYYATQVLHHWGGEPWKRWNAVMREHLIQTQHPAEAGHRAGSWELADPHGSAGGRLYMTCLAVMTLEVYYRHLPLYQRDRVKSKAVDDGLSE